MKQILLSLVMIFCITSAAAKPIFPDSDTAKSVVELGVEGMQRLCPTGMWDHWTFRDIMFDRETNTVLMVVQLNSWSERKEEKARQATAQEQAKWIVSNFKAGYEDLIAKPQIMGDGDFMLYLSICYIYQSGHCSSRWRRMEQICASCF